MPETKGQDLETIREAFGSHKASDMPVIRQIYKLGSAAMVKLHRGRPVEAFEMATVQDRGIR